MTENIDHIRIEHLKAIRAEVHVFEDQARQQISMDNLAKRIEKRLDLS